MSVIEAEVQPAVETADLTIAERADLLRYEAVIKRGFNTFLEVGDALAAIRDKKLYRATHATFLDYCRERWGLGRSHVYRLMDAAEVAGNLAESSPIGEVGESVLRPLASLEPEQQREAWDIAVEIAGGNTPTAAQVEQAAAPYKPAPVWELEGKVSEWLDEYIGEGGVPTPDAVLDTLQVQTGRVVEPGSWLDQLDTWIREKGIQFRKRDLTQAIGNVREQRRQTQRQDELKTSAPQVAPAVYYAQAHEVVVSQPDPRLADARSLRDLLHEARTRVNADYGRLCGKWVEILGWYRATEKMIRDLDSLIAILEGTANV